MSLLLGVNIDHVATLRQARYALNPDAPIVEPSILEAARESEAGGADSITIHVREDRRHMQTEDAFLLKREIDLPINLEMANTPEMFTLAEELQPAFVCIVPESREEVTTEGGLDVLKQSATLKTRIPVLQNLGIKVSLFIDPDPKQIAAAGELGVEMIELHTGAFALAEGESRLKELARLQAGADQGQALGLQINAGHGIHHENLQDIFSIKHLSELNIGHTLIARAMFVGLRQSVKEMRDAMAAYQGGEG